MTLVLLVIVLVSLPGIVLVLEYPIRSAPMYGFHICGGGPQGSVSEAGYFPLNDRISGSWAVLGAGSATVTITDNSSAVVYDGFGASGQFAFIAVSDPYRLAVNSSLSICVALTATAMS